MDAGSRNLQGVNARERPESEDGFANNATAFESAPEPAVVAVVAVIAHHKILIRRNDLFYISRFMARPSILMMSNQMRNRLDLFHKKDPIVIYVIT